MASLKRKICVVTGTRAEYGLMKGLIRAIQGDAALELELVATGTHLSQEYGFTIREIEADGVAVDAKVDMQLTDDSAPGLSRSMGLALAGMGEAFARLRPDLVVVLGDRYETLAAATAALLAGIPIAHLHGGERTEGVYDESFRHAITKMAHLHFVAAEEYGRRVVQLGEAPERVFCFGAPGLDAVFGTKLLSREELEASTGFRYGKTNFLVTYHPPTHEKSRAEDAMAELLKALDGFSEAHVLITKPNADTDSRKMIALIEAYEARHPARVKVVASLGQTRYLSAVKQADVVVGNSSSGLIEVPLLKVPTVNIGARQQGRLRASSVIDCGDDAAAIVAAIRRALSPEFRATLSKVESPYLADGKASERIKDALKNAKLEGILIKTFRDVEVKA